MSEAHIAQTQATLARIALQFSPAVLASSLAAEDMVLTDMILRAQLPIGIFTLDTGRLHRETLAVLEQIKATYDYDVACFHPDATVVETYVREHGINAFYDSIDLRKKCCHMRKVEPLNRALAGHKAWITGQRRTQSVTRDSLLIEEFDSARGMAKFNPLADWGTEQVWDYIYSRQVPYNRLHDQGYPSIGCEPCTRAIEPHEDPRAGRWWWEQSDAKECGLHVVDGKLIKIKSVT